MSYETLSDEDKIITAIGFVARGVEIPTKLRDFLEAHGLLVAITNPMEVDIDQSDSNPTGRHKPCIS